MVIPPKNRGLRGAPHPAFKTISLLKKEKKKKRKKSKGQKLKSAKG